MKTRKFMVCLVLFVVLGLIGLVLGCSSPVTEQDVYSTASIIDCCADLDKEVHKGKIEQNWVLQISNEDFEEKYARSYYGAIERFYEEHDGYVDLDDLNKFLEDKFPGLFVKCDNNTRAPGDITGANTCCSSNEYCANPCRCREVVSSHECWVRKTFSGPITPPQR